MAKIISNWLNMVKIAQMAKKKVQIGSNWLRINQNGSEWFKMV